MKKITAKDIIYKKDKGSDAPTLTSYTFTFYIKDVPPYAGFAPSCNAVFTKLESPIDISCCLRIAYSFRCGKRLCSEFRSCNNIFQLYDDIVEEFNRITEREESLLFYEKSVKER